MRNEFNPKKEKLSGGKVTGTKRESTLQIGAPVKGESRNVLKKPLQEKFYSRGGLQGAGASTLLTRGRLDDLKGSVTMGGEAV